MRIGILHNAYIHRGGEEHVASAEAQLLRDAGHHVSTLTMDNRDAFASLGSKLSSYMRCAAGRNTHAAERIDAWARHQRLDVVHVHNIFPLITAAGPNALRALRVPVVATLHNFRLLCAAGTMTRSGKPCHDCLTKSPRAAIVNRCDRGSALQTTARVIAQARAFDSGRGFADLFIAPSSHVREAHIEAGMDPGRIVVRPHFTDLTPCPTPRGTGAIAIGRLDAAKGVAELAKRWPADAPRLTVVGEGPLEHEAKSAAAANVRFTGQLDRDALRRELINHALLIAPSRLPETFGLTLIEAAACSVPAVAFDSGATPDLIDHNRTGILVEPSSFDIIIDAARALLDDTHRIHALGQAAFARCQARFTPAAGIESLEAIYRRVISPAPAYRQENGNGHAA